jgi:hypothetical protein
MMESASPDALLQMWEHANDCLRTADESGNEAHQRAWRVHIAKAESRLRQLGIDPLSAIQRRRANSQPEP